MSLMTDNSSFQFGSVFVSDYTFVCLFEGVCVCETEKWKREERGVCSVIKRLSNCREPRCVACQIVLPLWPEVSCRGNVCVTAYVCLNVMNFNCLLQVLAGCLSTRDPVDHISCSLLKKKQNKTKKTMHFYLYVVCSTL